MEPGSAPRSPFPALCGLDHGRHAKIALVTSTDQCGACLSEGPGSLGQEFSATRTARMTMLACMADSEGFWSYVHDDDEAEGGRITRLARDVTAQYEMISGEKISLFLDRDILSWGDNWREKIDHSLETTAFFVAVLTPRYFTSSECRRELRTFVRGAEQIGIKTLVLPLVYLDIPGLNEDAPQDDAVSLVKTFQWADWRQLRFADPSSGEYRKAVAELAQRLVDANREILSQELTSATDTGRGDSPIPSDNDEPGLIDLIAAGEVAMPAWAETVTALGTEMTLFGTLTEGATKDIQDADQSGKGAAGRLTVARKFAKELMEPADRIMQLANKYASQSYDVDAAFRTMIAAIPDEVERDPNAKSAACEFFGMITTLAQNSQDAMSGLKAMVQQLGTAESLSRDLRPPLQKLKKGLTIMIEASAVIDGWKKAIADSPIDCSGASSVEHVI
jgi:hypothetical protein